MTPEENAELLRDRATVKVLLKAIERILKRDWSSSEKLKKIQAAKAVYDDSKLGHNQKQAKIRSVVPPQRK